MLDANSFESMTAASADHVLSRIFSPHSLSESTQMAPKRFEHFVFAFRSRIRQVIRMEYSLCHCSHLPMAVAHPMKVASFWLAHRHLTGIHMQRLAQPISGGQLKPEGKCRESPINARVVQRSLVTVFIVKPCFRICSHRFRRTLPLCFWKLDKVTSNYSVGNGLTVVQSMAYNRSLVDMLENAGPIFYWWPIRIPGKRH